jgi:hypothetical protein
MFDFGVERAGWFEINASLPFASYVDIQAGISKYNVESILMPRQALTQYNGQSSAGLYRLEPTPGLHLKSLYAGFRYAFLYISFDASCTSSTCAPLNITGVRCVAQVMPLTYSCSFGTAAPTQFSTECGTKAPTPLASICFQDSSAQSCCHAVTCRRRSKVTRMLRRVSV